MSLEPYRRRRDFDRSHEPSGDPPTPAGDEPLRFLVQKHDASHLHYDLRLELDGVLLSWALPKGPSLSPYDRRLALRVEDHPLEYGSFEGLIPPGNYGAGSVMLWDEGTYGAPGVATRAASEAALRSMLERGRLKFILHGLKLTGEFSLSQARTEEPKNWLLIKKSDDGASPEDVTIRDRSVRTGRSMAEIAAAGGPYWLGQGIDNPPAGAPASGRPLAPTAEALLSGAPAGPLPRDLRPMLATPIVAAFDRPDWLYEVKWDGFRAIGEIASGKAKLYSRNNLDFSSRYPTIVSALEALAVDAVLDGEIVVLDGDGVPQFQMLQSYLQGQEGVLAYFAFDIVHLAGRDLMGLPLTDRKEILTHLLSGTGPVRLSEHFAGSGSALYERVTALGFEGIVAKNGASLYRPGVRSSEWLKVKANQTQSAVIAGYTAPSGGRKELGSLILGVYEGGKLVHIGHAGSGFDEAELTAVKQRLLAYIRDDPPFEGRIEHNSRPTWVRPQLVADFKHAGWTADGKMRQPVFLRLRDDLDPAAIVRETAAPPPPPAPRPRSRSTAPKAENLEIGGRPVAISHADKLYWPDDGLTKGDAVEYYRKLAPVLLPYLRDRPLSLLRFPDGINGDRFYHKDFGSHAPDWVTTVTRDDDRALVCQDEATLAYVANLAGIELHPWHSRRQELERPDYCVIDLDPLEIDLDSVVRVAQEVRAVLAAAGVTGHPKTSGGDGLHVYLPLGALYDYAQSLQFATLVGHLVHARLPELTSLERNPDKRRGRVYLDCLQNRRGQTVIAPYSLRARRGAPVSTPLRWEEVAPELDPLAYNLRTFSERLLQVGDLWAPVLGPGIDMLDALRRLEELAKTPSTSASARRG